MKMCASRKCEIVARNRSQWQLTILPTTILHTEAENHQQTSLIKSIKIFKANIDLNPSRWYCLFVQLLFRKLKQWVKPKYEYKLQPIPYVSN